MNKHIAIAAMAWVAASGVSAQVLVKPMVGFGVTAGGDTIATVYYQNSNTDESRVHAGALFALHGGLELQFTSRVSTQFLFGYHVDQVRASNATVRWSRTPVEALGHVYLTDWFRLGGGARYSANARLHASGVASNTIPNTSFKASLGGVVEGEFFPYRSVGIKVRYVNERFKVNNGFNDVTLDGSHGGVYVGYYF